jgi:hypothetical protein
MCYSVQIEEDSPKQAVTASLGESLPGLIVANVARLHLDPEETPEDGVQVDYKMYHPRVVNGVDIWILIQFAEYVFDDATRLSIRDALIEVVTGWFDAHNVVMPDVALDILWGPDHGFLQLGPTRIEW